MQHGNNNQSVGIYAYSDTMRIAWQKVHPDLINATLKQAARDTGLIGNCGYEDSNVSSHSLRAGGAMALHLNGEPDLTIRKLGRWKSNTFEMYIHEQISAFSAGLSIKMSTHIPFRAIATPRLDPAP